MRNAILKVRSRMRNDNTMPFIKLKDMHIKQYIFYKDTGKWNIKHIRVVIYREENRSAK